MGLLLRLLAAVIRGFGGEALRLIGHTSPNMEQVDLIWQNGEFVPWEDAKVHVLSHGLHYGTGVFEGIRCYETERGPAVFRHADHLDRLAKSAELYYLRAALLGRGDPPRRRTS